MLLTTLSSLLWIAPCPGGAAGTATPEAAAVNVVVICIDTLRADHLSSYGYERPTTPHLDRLAARGQRFARAYSTAPWTLPSVASLLTGLKPERHRADGFLTPISPQAETLAVTFHELDFQTAGVIGNYFLQPVFGLGRGFQSYNGDCLADRNQINSDCLSDRTIAWLRESARPGFFLYLHYFDPHYNYFEHEGFSFGVPDTERVHSGQEIWELRESLPSFTEADRDRLLSLYDSEVAFTDHHVGRVLDLLDELGFADTTYVVVTSDHGEALGEHGWVGHTVQVYEESIHVPLILAGPGIPAGVVERVVQIDSIAPTLLDLCGLPAPAYGLCGESLCSTWAAGEEASAGAEAVASTRTPMIPSPQPRESIERRTYIQVDQWKLFVDEEEDGPSYRIFAMDEPQGRRKKDPRRYPDRVQLLLQAIERDYQERLAEWDREDRRRQQMEARQRTLIRWPWKLIWNEKEGRHELYNLRLDAGETRDLGADEPERLSELSSLLRSHLAELSGRALAPPPPLSQEDSAELRERISALGYTR